MGKDVSDDPPVPQTPCSPLRHQGSLVALASVCEDREKAASLWTMPKVPGLSQTVPYGLQFS